MITTKDDEIRFTIGDSALGSILVGASSDGVCAILFGSDAADLERELQDRFPDARLARSDAELAPLLARIAGFIETPEGTLDLPLDLRGTAFQQQVWRALREIPPGATESYSEVAERIGAPKEAYAVAEACAANPLAVAIPCHRVVRKGGALGGYRWGFRRKLALLRREARARKAR